VSQRRVIAGVSVVATAVVLSCGPDRTVATHALPARLTLLSAPADTVLVGAEAGDVQVRVVDASDRPVGGVPVTFAFSIGGGTLSASLDTTNVDGVARTAVTIRTSAGPNEIVSSVKGVDPIRTKTASIAGPIASLVLASKALRLPSGRDVGFIPVSAVDRFGNVTDGNVTWAARDSTFLRTTTALNNTVTVNVLRRPAEGYLIASSGSIVDSARVLAPDAAAPCAFSPATPTSLPTGAVVTFDGATACIRGDDASAEYAAIVHYRTSVTQASLVLDVLANGVTTPSAAFPAVATAAEPVAADWRFERDLRGTEREQLPARAAAARAWYREDRPSLAAQPAAGQRVDLNVNPRDFCDRPDVRRTRVVAVTDGVVVYADTANPDGGFTDTEYREFAIGFDTLVNAIDTAAFGAPSDVDHNGRVAILFTRAVNELTAQGSPGGVVLGFYYARDLLPRISVLGDCPGSNVGEMFYLMVPDPTGSVNGNQRTKAFVQGIALGTIAHEYQHLINASRRLYVTRAPQIEEEPWLNEGLSHIAEELLFYRVSGLQPRQRISADVLASGTVARAAFDAYARNNVSRYREFLRAPEGTSPLAIDDRLATRGAAWSFLRYLADRTRPVDGDFWRRLVNSTATGTLNLDATLAASGMTALEALSEWSVSVLANGTTVDTAAVYRQSSWNFPSVMPGVGLSYTLAPRTLPDGVPTSLPLQSGGSGYLRFAVPQGRDAFIQVTGFNGVKLPVGVQLTIVRIK